MTSILTDFSLKRKGVLATETHSVPLTSVHPLIHNKSANEFFVIMPVRARKVAVDKMVREASPVICDR